MGKGPIVFFWFLHLLVPCQWSASQCGLQGLGVFLELLLDALSNRLWARRAFCAALCQRRTLQAFSGISCREGLGLCMNSQTSLERPLL